MRSRSISGKVRRGLVFEVNFCHTVRYACMEGKLKAHCHSMTLAFALIFAISHLTSSPAVNKHISTIFPVGIGSYKPCPLLFLSEL
jgi:hypothetical protein